MRLERIDPACNARRYYEIGVTGSLFGGVALVRRWGRIGRMGTMRVELYASAPEAAAAYRRWRRAKRRRGYRRVAS